VVLSDIAEFTHFVTRVKLVPSVADDLSLSEAERTRGKAFATALSMRVLSRTWQMLLKGLAEVQQATRPVAAAEMLLVRIAYAADLPTPDEAIRALASGSTTGATAIAAPRGNGGGMPTSTGAAPAAISIASSRTDAPLNAPRSQAAPVLNMAPHPAASPAVPQLALGSFEQIVQLAAEKRDLKIKAALERDVRLVRCEDGKLEIALETGAAPALVNELSGKLTLWTNRQWVVVVSREPGQPTLKAQLDAREADLKRGVRGDPLVQAVLERFPGAEIVAVRPRETEQPQIGEVEPDLIADGGDSDDDSDSER
jgi:DNA polymerase-3 subunit gamma/tau